MKLSNLLQVVQDLKVLGLPVTDFGGHQPAAEILGIL